MDADLYQVTYIVTFFSHFGAVRYKQLCAGYLPPGGACAEEIEQIAAWDGQQYTTVYHTDETED